ncbi:hypothetical protein PHYC_03964 [Phycisphaerales bacterium]|nr:hypothetical protein PHYC_03964 [Phycisphaerales bacterium]
MSKGRQDAGPEWRAICAAIRKDVLEVCPLSNRHFHTEPGTFRRQEIARRAGVSLANLSRMMDECLPSSPDTITRLAKFLGVRVVLERVGSLPIPRSYPEAGRRPRGRGGRSRGGRRR